MTNLKTLGRAVLAVFAFSAMMASTASADLFTSSSGSENTDLTGATVSGVKPTWEPSPGAGGVECAKGTYAGTVTGNAVEEVTIHPVYDGPCSFGETFPLTVNTDGCDYVMTGRTDGGSDATLEVECTNGKEITVEVWVLANHGTEPADVVLHIPGGQLLKGVHYTNKNTAENAAGSETVTVKATVTGIHATCTGEFCFLVGGETLTEGTYTNDLIITGYEDTGDFTRQCEHVWAGTHGKQVHISVSGSVPGVSAEDHETADASSIPCFHSETSKTTLIAEDTGSEEMSFEAGTATCSEAGYKGTMSVATAATLTIKPEFASCEAFGFASSEVLFNGCAYVLHRGESVESSEGSVDIECPSGKKIEVLAHVRGLLKCRVTIGGQSGLTTITETNKGSGASRDIALDLALAKVSYTQEAGEGLGKCSSGSFKNGEIIGAPTMIGENEAKEQVGIWAE